MSSVPRAAVGRGTCMPRALLLQEQPLLCVFPSHRREDVGPALLLWLYRRSAWQPVLL